MTTTMSETSETRGDERYERLAARFRPVFARIGVDSLEREQAGRLAHEQLGWLTEAGFARLRTPSSLGGFGARLSDLLRLLAELAEVDVNLAHIWRNHYSFVEDRLSALDEPSDTRSAVWLERLGRGEIIGGGWSESGPFTQETVETTIVPTTDGYRVDGAKYYSTGSVYAHWFTVLAVDPAGARTVALVPADQPGVTIGDDWDGFGQKLTGSGSVTYRGAHVAPGDAIPYASRYEYASQYYQSVLHSLLVGIGRAVLRDGIAALRARRRSHGNGTTSSPVDDPQILEVIGRVSSLVFGASSAFERSIDLVDRFVASGSEADRQQSWLAVAQAQGVVTDAVLEAATLVFDALGASGTSSAVALDRHWRNARTLASHNPRVFKQRLAGGLLVNGMDPTAH
ncbi:hypothetical protein AX769_16285 [Frondihabitans sp. PAMC 28766]|uniref:acyl-CoA dehydrogenase family protein n=1 Tax=Frondihabitans sp. PAMC 28766 TaxID=1795630 RepID=UPI00078D194C|nr:acyl-CoA dehydrogenase family protein [Frondihabitans sp. PAMC 28766]AMM21403.1 hypothetical protein AX769_16285 [Frondihabitans sp. PAMC 28766]